jgi:hypothetical protein
VSWRWATQPVRTGLPDAAGAEPARAAEGPRASGEPSPLSDQGASM